MANNLNSTRVSLKHFLTQLQEAAKNSEKEDIKPAAELLSHTDIAESWVEHYALQLTVAADHRVKEMGEAQVRREILNSIKPVAKRRALFMLTFLSEAEIKGYFEWIDPLDMGVMKQILSDGLMNYAYQLFLVTQLNEELMPSRIIRALTYRAWNLELGRIGLSAAAWKGVKLRASLQLEWKQILFSDLLSTAIYDPKSYPQEDDTTLLNSITDLQTSLKTAFN